MPIATAITERGFRKWYERELIRSHSHLVLLILCAVAVLGALEAYSSPGAVNRVLMVLSFVIAAVVGIWTLRRYLFLLARAELIANQATCPHCGVYARWQVEGSSGAGKADEADGSDESAPTDTPASLQVCCRKCSHRWRIEW